ncbi:hypothetical protein MUP77_05130 [Candidatus Bathyarchaeota archaeon]|nr:hypothetical protein [Candidatus Bathyarchaeota archaeon]
MELQSEKETRIATEKAFNKTVDKLILRISNLEQEIDISLGEPKENLFARGDASRSGNPEALAIELILRRV